jgi:chorismate mutase / prephenate dehydratase
MLPVQPLDSLRQQIDQIDSEIHDLLMRRTEIVERIKEAKGDGPAMRPSREAAIMRRLAGRHRGELPVAAVIRIWRELIAALTRLQAPVAVAVYAPDGQRRYWDMARDQYGSLTPMTPHPSAMAVLRAVTDGSATVGVLPRPEDGEANPWWPLLASDDKATPSVIARLPFCGSGETKAANSDAFAVARLPQERSGDDCSLFVVEAGSELSRSRLNSVLQSSGLSLAGVFGLPARDSRHGALHLIEVSEYVTAEDERLSALGAKLGAKRPMVIGSYARPLAFVAAAAPVAVAAPAPAADES